MKHRRAALLLGIVSAGMFWAGTASAKEETPKEAQKKGTSTQRLQTFAADPHIIRIYQPNVRAPETTLPITVYRNDRVMFRAGGCVQTGGRGKTWKRYVNPSGPNSGELYHGQIYIPGAIERLTNLSDFLGAGQGWSQQFIVGAYDPEFVPGNIALGYTDDGYEDNGYWGHDDGTENQCRSVGPAWIDIRICRADPAHGPTC